MHQRTIAGADLDEPQILQGQPDRIRFLAGPAADRFPENRREGRGSREIAPGTADRFDFRGVVAELRMIERFAHETLERNRPACPVFGKERIEKCAKGFGAGHLFG